MGISSGIFQLKNNSFLHLVEGNLSEENNTNIKMHPIAYLKPYLAWLITEA